MAVPPPPNDPPPQGSVYVQSGRTNGFAVASLVLGILWIFWIGSVLALIFGFIAKSQIDKSNGAQSGSGLAIAGIVLGCVGVGTLLLAVLFGEWTFDSTTY